MVGVIAVSLSMHVLSETIYYYLFIYYLLAKFKCLLEVFIFNSLKFL